MGSRVQSDSFLLVAPSNSGKKKKNAKVGPFYFFMMDKKDEWIQDGTLSENPSMKQLVDKCKPLWYAMKTNPLLMEPYIEKARDSTGIFRIIYLMCYFWHGSSNFVFAALEVVKT